MDIEAPLRLHRDVVRPEWIDYNGHMNVAYYVLAFDWNTDAFFDFIGLGPNYMKERGCSTFAVEAHVTYLRELRAGDRMRFESYLLGCDAKRLHHFHHMYHEADGHLTATAEWLSVHIDMSTRRTAPFPDDIRARLAAVKSAHDALPRPPQVGRVIGLSSGRAG